MSILLLSENDYDEEIGAISVDSNISLYIAGHSISTLSSTLFISGLESINNNRTLYTASADEINDDFTLYTDGIGFISSNITLQITGEPVNNNFTLYTSGFMIDTKSLNLSCITSPSASANTNNVNLSINGAATDGELFNTTTLFIEASHAIAHMNLSVIADDTGLYNKSLNLSTAGYYGSAYKNVDLICYNNGPSLTSTLFIKGDGTTAGALPSNGSMNLYLDRPIGDMINLFLCSPVPTTNEITLFCAGAYLINNSFTMSMPVVLDIPTLTRTLYTHGF